MLQEYGRVRVRATGMYGTIVDWSPGNEYCLVELDGWQHDGDEFGDRQWPYDFAIADLDELVEVKTDQLNVKSLSEAFEILVISSWSSTDLGNSPEIVVKRIENDVEVIVHSFNYAINETKLLKGTQAAKLLSVVFVLLTRIDGSAPSKPIIVSQGSHSCRLTVYSDNHYFQYDSNNTIPEELVTLLYAVADCGLPLAWNGHEMLLSGDSQEV